MKLVCWIAALGMAALAVQSPLARGQQRAFPIVSLKVEGNQNFSEQQILAVAGLQLGQPAEPKAFEAARDRLMASGFFETVGYKYAPSADKTGYAASFLVTEIQQAYPVKFDRLPQPEADLLAVLRKSDPLFSPKVPGTQQLLARYAAFLEPVVKEKVIGKVMPDLETRELVIVFQPARLPPSIAEITFTGNQVIPTRTLQNAVAGAAVGTVWEEKRFRQILDNSIRPLYEARGRIRVEFPKITTEPVTDVTGLRLNVEVAEGDVYKLGEVDIPSAGDARRELLRAADFKQDDIANFDAINEGLERIRKLVRSNGYLHAKVRADRTIDDKAKLVALTIHIDRGGRYTFTKLTIVGLDILTEPHIRKMWAIKEGQPYNPEYAEAFLARIREEGILENLGKTKADVQTNDKDLTAAVTLYFSGEGPPAKKRFP
jgi:outer membrane protein assembly factor BamA